MKKLIIFSVVVILTLSNCTNLSIKSNQYLGELPSLEKIYSEKINSKKKELKEYGKKVREKMNNASKSQVEKYIKNGEAMQEEINAIANEHKEAVENHLSKKPLINTEIPFDGLENEQYSINKAIIDKAGYAYKLGGYISFNFPLTIKKDIAGQHYHRYEKYTHLYFKALDSHGQILSVNSAMNARPVELKKGTNLSVTPTCYHEIANFEAFAKLVQISKAEYDQLK
jgi:hypothetical protein